jgi:hypothetical protein
MSMLKEIRRDEQPGYSWYLCDCGNEKKIRREEGFKRVYDCGQAKFVKQNTPRF